ncbi:TPA: hypothetical protein MW242_002890 [Acinetobacter baumannii]|nr:hypothetical protein [Acinetobacter baumannii]
MEFKFPTETFEVNSILCYSSSDRINLENRYIPRSQYNSAKVKDVLFDINLNHPPNEPTIKSFKIKVVRIYDFVCSSTGVRSYIYKYAKGETAFLYQKRPFPEKDFILTFPTLTHLYNDCIELEEFTTNAFKGLNFKYSGGMIPSYLQERIIAYAKKKNRPLYISETVRGVFREDSNMKFNIFARNAPKLDDQGKPVGAKRKLITLKQSDGTDGQKVAIFHGDCYSPVIVKKHFSEKLQSDDKRYYRYVDFLILYSVEQDLYSLYTPTLRLTNYENRVTYFHDLVSDISKLSKSIDRVREQVIKNLNESSRKDPIK